MLLVRILIVIKLGQPGVTLERSAIWSNEELLKVPGNVRPLDRGPGDEPGVAQNHTLSVQFDKQREQKITHLITLASVGSGKLFFKNVKSGSSFSPFTST